MPGSPDESLITLGNQSPGVLRLLQCHGTGILATPRRGHHLPYPQSGCAQEMVRLSAAQPRLWQLQRLGGAGLGPGNATRNGAGLGTMLEGGTPRPRWPLPTSQAPNLLKLIRDNPCPLQSSFMSPDVTKFELFPPDCLNKPVTFDPSWSDWLKRVSFCLFFEDPSPQTSSGSW